MKEKMLNENLLHNIYANPSHNILFLVNFINKFCMKNDLSGIFF